MKVKRVINAIYKGRKVRDIALAGLKGEEDIILLIRELSNSYPDEKWKQAGEDRICDLIRGIESETDDFIKGDQQKLLSTQDLKKQVEEERRALKLYEKPLKEIFTTLSKVDF